MIYKVGMLCKHFKGTDFLTDEEISIISSEEFIQNKNEMVVKKFAKKM